MKWFLKVLQQYSDFDGRARRKEFWIFMLFNWMFGAVASTLDIVLGFSWGFFFLLNGLYSIVLFIPSLAVAVRRLHDIGKSGWMLLILLIPVVGGIWMLVLLLREGNSFENEYGPYPKGVIFF